MRQKAGKIKSLAYKHEGNYFVRLFHKVRKSVVAIQTILEEEDAVPYLFPLLSRQERAGIGTGFIINRRGTILTNEHVVKEARQVTVKLYNGKRHAGRVVWSDPVRDIALVQTTETLAIPPIQLGSSAASKVGELVMSIGNPLGLEHSITTGVISAKNRSFRFANSEKMFEEVIQTDCAINPGSSGGPLINLNGQVIGMNAFVAKDNQGLGFAIGIDGIKKQISRFLT